MSNLGDALRAAAAKTNEIDAELDELIATVERNQTVLATAVQQILDAIAAIPGAGDLSEIKAHVDELVATLIPEDAA